MAIRLPGSSGAPPTPAPAAKQPSQAERDTEYLRQRDVARGQQQDPAPSPSPPRSPPPQRAAASGYDDNGFSEKPAPREGDGNLPFANTFEERKPGRYTDLCCVEQIIHWAAGPQIVLRVRVGDDAGREIKWDQAPPAAAQANEKWLVNWTRDLFSAYAAGGWMADPIESTGWGGWPRSKTGAYIPPYADFFVTTVGGVHVPFLLSVSTQVDARTDGRGYGDTYPPKVTAVRPHKIDGVLVQAPLPRKLTPWIAERHLWTGTREDIVVKPSGEKSGYVVPSVKVTWDQVARGVGGMKGLKDC